MQHLEACFTVALPVCVVCTILRILVNVVAERALPKPASPDAHKQRLSLLEESWLFVSSTVLLTISTWVSEFHNGGCSLVSHEGCFEDWPVQEHSPPFTAALALFLGWYIHCVIKSLVPGIGLHAGIDMVGHHVLTLALLAFSHVYHVQRMGLLVLSLLNFSSPFMHAAKIMHYGAARPPLKAGMFMLFAAAFALSRCLLFPRIIHYCIATARYRVSIGQNEVIIPAIVTISGLGLLQVLQYYWMWRIVRVIMRGGLESKSQRDAAVTAKAPPTDGAGSTASPEPPIAAPSLAAHISPAPSPDTALAGIATGDPHAVLNELSDNVLDSPTAGSPGAPGVYRRPKAATAAANGATHDAEEDAFKAA